MATKFSELRPLIRSILGDTNPSALVYSDHTIDNHIRLIILSGDNSDIQESDPRVDPPVFTEDLSSQEKATIVFKAARGVISFIPNEFAYQTPVMKVRRKGVVSQILANIDRNLSDIEGMPISSENEIEAYVNAWNKFYDQLAEAQV